jgi:hypothetical protein
MPDITPTGIFLMLIYLLGISVTIVGIILLSLMIADTGPFKCNFPNGDPLLNSGLSESLDALRLSYTKANDFAMFYNGLEETSLKKCFRECARRTCYIPQLQDPESCQVSCSSYGSCISQCETCDVTIALQLPTISTTCINLEDCGHFGFQ